MQPWHLQLKRSWGAGLVKTFLEIRRGTTSQNTHYWVTWIHHLIAEGGFICLYTFENQQISGYWKESLWDWTSSHRAQIIGMEQLGDFSRCLRSYRPNWMQPSKHEWKLIVGLLPSQGCKNRRAWKRLAGLWAMFGLVGDQLCKLSATSLTAGVTSTGCLSLNRPPSTYCNTWHDLVALLEWSRAICTARLLNDICFWPTSQCSG